MPVIARTITRRECADCGGEPGRSAHAPGCSARPVRWVDVEYVRADAYREKPEHRPLTPRPGWTQEQEYIALSEEFFAVEESRDRLAVENESLKAEIERLRTEK